MIKFARFWPWWNATFLFPMGPQRVKQACMVLPLYEMEKFRFHALHRSQKGLHGFATTLYEMEVPHPMLRPFSPNLSETVLRYSPCCASAGHSLFPVNSGVLLKFLLLLAISTCLLGEDSLIWLTLVVAHSKSRQSSSQDPHQSWLASLSNSTFPQQPV